VFRRSLIPPEERNSEVVSVKTAGDPVSEVSGRRERSGQRLGDENAKEDEGRREGDRLSEPMARLTYFTLISPGSIRFYARVASLCLARALVRTQRENF